MFGGGSCSALDGLKCGLSSTPVSSRMGYTPNLSTPNLVSCLLYIGFLAISACFFLSFNHIGDFTISVSHFNAYLVLEFLSHEGILHFQDIVDEHEHCGWAKPIDLTIKASTSSPFEAHGQSLGWEYSQVFAVFMWCFLFVFHCFPLISIVFHWFLFHWFAYCFPLVSIATGPQEVIEIREDDCGNRVSWLLGIKKLPYGLKREVQPAKQAMQNQA